MINIRPAIFTVFLISVFGMLGYAQDVQLMPIPGSRPQIMTNADFAKIEYSASLDRFGKVSDKEKRARLDNFIGILAKDNKTVEYVVVLNSRVARDLNSNMEFIYLYMTRNKKIDPSRISFATSPDSELTELWLAPVNNIAVPQYLNISIFSAEDEKKLGEYFKIKK